MLAMGFLKQFIKFKNACRLVVTPDDLFMNKMLLHV